MEADKYKKAWDNRRHLEEEMLRLRRIRLMEKVKECAVAIKRIGGKRVVLFGSLATGRFRRGSDVDIAVEGLSSKTYFKAIGLVEDILGDIPFDIVDMEETLPTVRQKIEREGILV
ncbi:MAG TPA: nucleotidyltransferase domain-containing protein [Thermodesulfobacteriota bacterium]|nr:nucleotidyltransferase domain-containing protein [Thermodesulfobacteriota bacterium]